MRVAVVAGPDPGHAFPAIALCLRFLAAGDTPPLLTGRKRLDVARSAGSLATVRPGMQESQHRVAQCILVRIGGLPVGQ